MDVLFPGSITLGAGPCGPSTLDVFGEGIVEPMADWFAEVTGGTRGETWVIGEPSLPNVPANLFKAPGTVVCKAVVNNPARVDAIRIGISIGYVSNGSGIYLMTVIERTPGVFKTIGSSVANSESQVGSGNEFGSIMFSVVQPSTIRTTGVGFSGTNITSTSPRIFPVHDSLKADITATVGPVNAQRKVYIDETLVGILPVGVSSTQIKGRMPTTSTLRVVATGYIEHQQSIDLVPGENTLDVTLVPTDPEGVARLSIESNAAPEVIITVDSSESIHIGRAPCLYDVPIGSAVSVQAILGTVVKDAAYESLVEDTTCHFQFDLAPGDDDGGGDSPEGPLPEPAEGKMSCRVYVQDTGHLWYDIDGFAPDLDFGVVTPGSIDVEVDPPAILMSGGVFHFAATDGLTYTSRVTFTPGGQVRVWIGPERIKINGLTEEAQVYWCEGILSSLPIRGERKEDDFLITNDGKLTIVSPDGREAVMHVSYSPGTLREFHYEEVIVDARNGGVIEWISSNWLLIVTVVGVTLALSFAISFLRR